MRERALAIVLVALTGCQENPGLELHVRVPAGAIGSIDQLVLTLESQTGTFAAQAMDATAQGLSVHVDGSRLLLATTGAFKLATDFRLLLVPTAHPVTAGLSGVMYRKDGRSIGRANAAAAVTLSADRRTHVELTFACASSDCGPEVPAGAIDLSAPPLGIPIQHITSTSAPLTALGVGRFLPQRNTLVVANPTAGEVYLFHDGHFSAPKNLTTADADVVIHAAGLGVSGAIGPIHRGNCVMPCRDSLLLGGSADVVWVIAPEAFDSLGARLELGQSQPNIVRLIGVSGEHLGSAIALAQQGPSSAPTTEIVLGASGADGGSGRVYLVPPPSGDVSVGSGGAERVTLHSFGSTAPIGSFVAAGNINSRTATKGDDFYELIIEVTGRSFYYFLKSAGDPLSWAASETLPNPELPVTATIWANRLRNLPATGGINFAVLGGDEIDNLDITTADKCSGYTFLLEDSGRDGIVHDWDVGIHMDQFDGGLFGYSVAPGDFDGDGVTDLLVGAPGVTPPAIPNLPGDRSHAGAAFVLNGTFLSQQLSRSKMLQDMNQPRPEPLLSSVPALRTVYGAQMGGAVTQCDGVGGLGTKVFLGDLNHASPGDELIIEASALPGGKSEIVVLPAPAL